MIIIIWRESSHEVLEARSWKMYFVIKCLTLAKSPKSKFYGEMEVLIVVFFDCQKSFYAVGSTSEFFLILLITFSFCVSIDFFCFEVSLTLFLFVFSFCNIFMC